MRFGDYEAVQFIAAGGMGETWSGVKLSLTRSVAIKVLHPDAAGDADAQTQFLREARISAALEHGRIVSVLDYGIKHELIYLVMARVDGVDLRTFLNAYRKKGKLESLSPLLVAHVAGEILEALRYAHSRPVGGRSYGVIHRDIKPANVLISSNGEFFVTDFGIARYTEDATWRGHIVGTPCFMAPEQAEGRACPQSDIFGTGCVAYYLLTGRAPLNTDGSRVDTSLAYREPIPAVERNDIPPPLREFLRRSLAFDLSERYETADEALADLDKLKVSDTGERHSTTARRIYRSCVSGPKSHVTGYLQREDAGASFLLPYYLERAKAHAEGRQPMTIVPSQGRPDAMIIRPRDEDESDEDSGREDGNQEGSGQLGSGEEISGDDSMPWLPRSERQGDDDGAVPWYWAKERAVSGDEAESGDASKERADVSADPMEVAPPVEAEGRGSTLVLPPRGDDGVPVGRRPRTGTVPMPSSIAAREPSEPRPDVTETHPPRGSSREHASPFRIEPAPSARPLPRTERRPPPPAAWPVEVAAAPPPPAPAPPDPIPPPVVHRARRVTQAAPGARRRSPWLAAGTLAIGVTVLNLGWMAFSARDRVTAPSTEAATVDAPTAAVAAPAHPGSAAPPEPENGTNGPEPHDTEDDKREAARPEPFEDPVPSPAAAEPGATPSAATPPPDPEPEPPPKPEPKPRVMVLFFLKGATHGEVRIAGRTVAVESVATLHLRPGHYAVNWRRRGETEWHGAGKVKIPALDPKAEYSEIRLDDGSYKGIARPIPGKRGAR
jgi:serine/threonine protein kinase